MIKMSVIGLILSYMISNYNLRVVTAQGSKMAIMVSIGLFVLALIITFFRKFKQ